MPAQATTFVAAAWVAMIRPFRPGTHVIRVEIVNSDGTSFVSAAVVTSARLEGLRVTLRRVSAVPALSAATGAPAGRF